MSTTLFTHPDCECHELDRHPERPARLRAVMDQLNQSGLIQDVQVQLAEEVDTSHALRIHSAEHLAHIDRCEPLEDTIRLDPDTYMSPGSLRASKLAAGACTGAVQAVLEGQTNRAFCAVRPPGHHAEVANAMGFCLFNNIAIAAEMALQHASVERVAIVDFDVHHCNGTVDIFKDRAEVLVCSSFQADFYPFRYLDFTNEHIINTPLPEGSNGSGFRRAIESSWLPAIEAHRPDLILISAGFDAHNDDPLGGLCLIEDDFRWVTGQLIAAANQYADGRLISTLEGGYDLNALALSVEAHVRALVEG